MDLKEYSKVIAEQISVGHLQGGYRKLKEAYPEKLKEIETDLENNWSQEALKIYRERLIKGLQAVGAWND